MQCLSCCGYYYFKNIILRDEISINMFSNASILGNSTGQIEGSYAVIFFFFKGNPFIF